MLRSWLGLLHDLGLVLSRDKGYDIEYDSIEIAARRIVTENDAHTWKTHTYGAAFSTYQHDFIYQLAQNSNESKKKKYVGL